MSKVALLHYWLTSMRGGEKVLAEFCRLFPQADIFTHACRPEALEPVFATHQIRESFIARLPGAQRGCQRYLPLMPWALKQFDLRDYDLILSSESGPAKGIRKPAGTLHICYCHTPMRYVWDMYAEYFQAAGPLAKLAMRLCRDPLRRYDLRSAESVDLFLANSQCVAERIRRIYGRDSVVVYPPVDAEYYSRLPRAPQDYYLLAGAVTDYKRPELAIEACLRLNRKLIVAGEGNLLSGLRKTAAGKANIIFRGRVSNEELRELYAGAKALLFPGLEDFGIIPLEAQAAGTPVLAYGQGGALETVCEGSTGLFFPRQETESLCQAIEQYEAGSWQPEACRQNASRFTSACFREHFFAALRDFGKTDPRIQSLLNAAAETSSATTPQP